MPPVPSSGPEPRENAPCEVVLISGFLGSGKTTLLKNILNWPGDLSHTAILVNEFGQVGIDGQLLAGFETEVVEMTNGCICCTLQGDLVRTLKDLLEAFAPRRLLIEATGVADPYEILSVVERPEFAERFGPPKVVTVLDVDFWEAREHFGPVFHHQLKAAHLVLLNKVDLQPEENVSQCLGEFQEEFPSCSALPTLYCRIDPDVLWGLGGGAAAGSEDRLHEHFFHDETRVDGPQGFVAFSFEASAPLDEHCFREFISSLPFEVFRMKGYVSLGRRRWLVNHVGGHTEWTALDEGGPTQLAFVGWKVDGEAVISRLWECVGK